MIAPCPSERTRCRLRLGTTTGQGAGFFRPLPTMLAIRLLLGAIGFGGFLVWPALCIFVAGFPKFQIGDPRGPGFSTFEISLYVGTPLIAFIYYAFVSVATPRRLVAIVGVVLHVSLIALVVVA